MNRSPLLLLPLLYVGAASVTNVPSSFYFWQLGCQSNEVLHFLCAFYCSLMFFIVNDIFGENMLENEGLVPVFYGLIGGNNNRKAFDCVGTFEEAMEALRMSITRFRDINMIEASSERGKSSAEYSHGSSNMPVVLLRLEPFLTGI